MPEIVRYRSPEEIKEEEIAKRIKERGPDGEIRGGFVYEEEEGEEGTKRYIYIGNPYAERPTVVKIETRASKEEVDAIRQEIIPLPETFEILEAMATTYRLKQPLLIEGPTAVGKTYTAEKFTELLYGKGAKPLDFYCSGQTDVSELMAKWVPKVESEEEKKRWNDFLSSLEGHAQIANLAKEAEDKQSLPPEQRAALVHARLQELARAAGLSEKTQWRFQYGALPKAMSMMRNPDGTASFDDQGGDGYILHIEEVGLAEPPVINSLLKARGKRGQVAEEIQLWENGGRKIKAGPNFWMVFSTNPPEEYLARNEVDPALARGVVFKRIKELSPESLRLAAEYFFTYKIGEKPEKPLPGEILDIYNHPEIGKEIARGVGAFHNDFAKALKNGEKGRQQRIPLTLDDMARIADYILQYQVRSKETGLLDLPETLKRGITFYYVNRLADQETIKDRLKNWDEIMTGVTGATTFRGVEGVRSADVLNALVKEASLGPEAKAKQEAFESERGEREHTQARFAAEDQLASVMSNPNIPNSVKEMLKRA